jgi:4-amino-4-deoxy-L-arabinose transferase-like glycosyltransferase
VLFACAFLRVYKLDFQPLDDDEYASTQAIVAIARTGVPGFVPEEVWYTRSPVYHYLIGAVVALFGENLWAMRLPSAAFGVATALLTYRCGSRHLRRPWVGMGAMVLFTIHPFTIFSGHLARFYQQQQFFALLTFYWFCEGFAGRPSQRHRYLMVAAFLAAVLSQEITAIMGVQIALGVVLLGRDGGRHANLRLVIVGVCAMGLIVLDLLVFHTRCLTRLEGVSPNVEAAIKPHFWDPYNFVALFLSYSRLHVMPSVLFVLALPALARVGGRIVWCLLWFVLSGAALTNLLVTHVSLRYQYWLIPLWLLLAVRAMDALSVRLARLCHPYGTKGLGRAATMFAAIMYTGVVLAWSPWRIYGSYDAKILGDSTGAFRYIRSQLRPGDAITANEPHTHAAHLEAGRVDYDLSVPMLHDFVMLKKGRLIDRNGGAEVIGSLGQLIEACRRHPRLWVVLNREKFRSRGKNLCWEYPGARMELFLRKNMEIRYRGYQFTVFLWDASAGRLAPFRCVSD